VAEEKAESQGPLGLTTDGLGRFGHAEQRKWLLFFAFLLCVIIYFANSSLLISSAASFSGKERKMASAAHTAVRDTYLGVGSRQEAVIKYSASERMCDTTAGEATLITFLSLAQK